MNVGGLVDVGHTCNEHESQPNHKAGEAPAAVGFGAYVAVDMVSHGGQSKHGCAPVGSWDGQNHSRATSCTSVSREERLGPDSVKTAETRNPSCCFGCLKC